MTMYVEATEVAELTRDECLQLLLYQSFVGRIAFVVDERPMILPVNYLAFPDHIVFCTAPGSKLDAVARGASVAFEVDAGHPLGHTGWSVLVQGVACEITDTAELELLRRGPLTSWATSRGQHWVSISIEEISGRRIGPA